MVTNRNEAVFGRRRSSVSRGAGLMCAALAAGALLTGCGDGGDDDRAADSSTAQAVQKPAAPTSTASGGGSLTEDQSERKDLIPKGKVGYDKALSTAVKAVDKSKPVSIELKGPVAKPSWHAEVATADGTEHTVRVDAVTGKADEPQAKKDQDADDKRELADWLKKATVPPEQAVKTATDKTKGTVSSVELDDNDKKAVIWSVDVVTTDDWNKTTFDVDAANRKILREHVDRD
ncbi:PepSY domain-containing protein [Streptomyces aurantiacus]